MNGAPLGQHMAPPKRDLGRSLFLLPVDSIRPNPDQPRRTFDREELQELTISIAQVGLIQPLTVRRSGAGYELISGERRLRAAGAEGGALHRGGGEPGAKRPHGAGGERAAGGP